MMVIGDHQDSLVSLMVEVSATHGHRKYTLVIQIVILLWVILSQIGLIQTNGVFMQLGIK
ncbi:MAG: hypothetical protein CL464_10920 [Acidimicrobiaceae bacterium]|nr:hypothetical protein [Acidimicrobiaceae bacterium]